jgi:hypothetical protein
MAHFRALVGVVLFGASVLAVAPARACAAWDVEYALTGTLRLAETPFGKADGAHKVGPGSLVLRVEPGSSRVRLLAYSMHQVVKLKITAFFATIFIAATSTTRAEPDACGVAAEGVKKGAIVEWTTKVRAVRTDGQLTCTGHYCGRYGSPAPGTGPIKIGPSDMRIRPFEFSSDGKTFTMPFTLGAKTESPKQTSFLALTGREVKRTCVPQLPACAR